MRFEHREDGLHVWIRQSWLGDAIACNERGRNAIVHPDWSTTSDSMALGTAVHAGIEHNLNGGTSGEHEAYLRMEKLIGGEEGPLRYTLGLEPSALMSLASDLFNRWEADVRDKVIDEGVLAVEHYFEIDWFSYDHAGTQVVVHLEGTIDCVTEKRLWDWKTAGRPYKTWEKQQQSVQATAYSFAAAVLGLLPFPTQFTFAVLMRDGKPTQLSNLHRNERHVNWMQRQVTPLIRNAIILGLDQPWTTNDSFYLCSAKWCPAWSTCKGASLIESDLRTTSNKE